MTKESMTNEEAKVVLSCSSIQQFCSFIVNIDGKLYSAKEALDVAIKALSKQSEDTVSRAVILNEISDIDIRAFRKYGRSFGFVTELYNFVRDLPSVTMQDETEMQINGR
jgi:hypothetical protein